MIIPTQLLNTLHLVTRMAASSFGQIDAFQPENESIEAYLECIEVFFAANEIAKDKQVSVFLSVLGGKTFTLMRNLLAPAKPNDQILGTIYSEESF